MPGTADEMAAGGGEMVHCAGAAADQAARQHVVPGAGVRATGVAGGGREPEGLPCPRCESVNTKFCYYNNYNQSQPRHFCRACRRYWTRGGALRNVPVGGGSRKAALAGRRNKRAAAPAPAPASPAAAPLHGALLRSYAGLPPFPAPALASPLAAVDPDRRMLDFGGSFTSLIAPDVVGANFSAAAFLMGGFAPAAVAHAPAPAALPLPTPLPPPPPTQQQQQQPMSQALSEGLIWNMGCWPDLSI